VGAVGDEEFGHSRNEARRILDTLNTLLQDLCDNNRAYYPDVNYEPGREIMQLKLKPLSEQTIVITGATSGIGLCTARMAASRGANVVAVAWLGSKVSSSTGVNAIQHG